MKIRDYLTEEVLEIVNKDHVVLGTRKLKFTKKNIEKIAYEWDAKIIDIETDIKNAMLKDRLGRYMFVQKQRSKRYRNRMKNRKM